MGNATEGIPMRAELSSLGGLCFAKLMEWITAHATHMKLLSPLLLLFVGVAVDGLAADKASLDEHLEPLRPFLGKTWKGHFKNSTPEKPQVDVARWERALNGKAVRVLHSINDGIYGGESMIVWDDKKKSLVYYYFTTGGFYTTGTLSVNEGKFTSHEMVTGSAEGVTEVKATTELGADGTMHTKSEYLKEAKWVPGHEVNYKEDPKAEVV